jgi:hypothetical protein
MTFKTRLKNREFLVTIKYHIPCLVIISRVGKIFYLKAKLPIEVRIDVRMPSVATLKI